MKTEVVGVTPQLASEWLRLNTRNRKLRRFTVDTLKRSFERGEYVQSHQGIAFSANNEVIDGQHRLTAISELKSGVFPMLVTWGVPEDAFMTIDRGVKRTTADSLFSDRRVTEVATLFATFGDSLKRAPSPQQMIPFISKIEPIHSELMAHCSTARRTWSATPVRAAAVLSIMSGESKEYVKHVYRALVLTDLNAMPPVARALVKAQMDGSVSMSNKMDALARCMVAFSYQKAKNVKIQISSTANIYKLVRETFSGLLQ